MPIRPVKKTSYIHQDKIETDDNRIMSVTGLTDEDGDYFHIKSNGGTATRTDTFFTRLQLDYEMSLD